MSGRAEKYLDPASMAASASRMGTAASATKFKVLPTAILDAHPGNREVDPKAVERLAASIERDGQGQPVLVRPMLGGRYQIVAGHHRVAAVRLLAERHPDDSTWLSVEAVVKGLTDAEADALLVATNVAMSAMDPAERGRAYLRLQHEQVPRMRAQSPEKYRGMSSGQIVADLASQDGSRVSRATVYRDMAAARAEESWKSPEGMPRALARKCAALPSATREKVVDAWISDGRDAAELAADFGTSEGGRKAMDAAVRTLAKASRAISYGIAHGTDAPEEAAKLARGLLGAMEKGDQLYEVKCKTVNN